MKNIIYVECECKPHTHPLTHPYTHTHVHYPSQKDLERFVHRQSADFLSISTLDLLEISILYTLEMSAAATYPNASASQQSCSWMKNKEHTDPIHITYEYPTIIKLIDPKH